jgi:hypothetical protein
MAMQRLELQKTKDTPHVVLDPVAHTGVFRGESKPENAADWWQVIIDWIADYIGAGRDLTLTFDINYYNTSSSKWLLDVFELLNTQYEHAQAINTRQRISVTWRVCTTPADHEYDREEAHEWLEQGWKFPFFIELYYDESSPDQQPTTESEHETE